MIVIYGELYSKKNSKRIIVKNGRRLILPSKVYEKNKRELMWQLQANKKDFAKMFEGKEKPLRIKLKIFRKTKGRFDFINCVQGIFDCMVSLGILPDDDANNLIPVFEKHEVDKYHPRVEISVI